MPDLNAELAKLAERNQQRMEQLQPPLDPIKIVGQQLRLAIAVLATEDQVLEIEIHFQQFLSQLLDMWEQERTKAQLVIPSGSVVPDITGDDVQGHGRQRGGLRVVN